MNLFILRHGLAVEPGSVGLLTDADRRLTPKGERKLRQIAKAMSKLDLCFDYILSSPYLRAKQTAEIVADHLDLTKELTLCEALMPGGSPKRLIAQIHQLKPSPKSLMIVGHEPYLSELISVLVSGDIELAIVMKKAGLCKLNVDELKYGQCAALEWLLTPKHLRLMA